MLILEFRLQKQFPQRTWRKSCRVLLTPRSVSGSGLLGLSVNWVYCVTWHQVRILTPSSTARWMAPGGHPKWSCEDECNCHHQNLTTRAWKSVAYSKYALTCIYTIVRCIYIYNTVYTDIASGQDSSYLLSGNLLFWGNQDWWNTVVWPDMRLDPLWILSCVYHPELWNMQGVTVVCLKVMYLETSGSWWILGMVDLEQYGESLKIQLKSILDIPRQLPRAGLARVYGPS